MEENKDFWDQVNKTIEEAAELIDEEIPLLKNDKSPLFGHREDDEDAEEAMKEHEEKRVKAKDQDMSKVALKGIDSSIGAWSYLRGKLTSEWETIKPMIRMLLWLKMEVEKEFPNAKNFVWPPQPEDE